MADGSVKAESGLPFANHIDLLTQKNKYGTFASKVKRFTSLWIVYREVPEK